MLGRFSDLWKTYTSAKLWARIPNHIKSVGLKTLKITLETGILIILIAEGSGCKCHLCST